MNERNLRYFTCVNKLIEGGQSFVSVTLVTSIGHAPQDPAAKMVVTGQGRQEGTVGGGKVEAKAIQFAVDLLASASNPTLLTWNLQRDVGMSCGGEVSLFFEPYCTNRWPIAIFGAGHVAQALIRLLIQLDCSVHCVDSRAEWLERLPASPRMTKILHPFPAEAAAQIPPDSFIGVMTQGHAHDMPILRTILSAGCPPFIGVIGSAVKGAKIRAELLAAGVSSERIERLHCPIGLPLGNNSPEEIAISVAAQMIQTRDALFSVTER